MRFAFDVTPLSVPRTGIGNYIRGVLSGIDQKTLDEHEIIAFSLCDRRGTASVRQALSGLALGERLVTAPAANVIRRVWSAAGHPGLERLLGPVNAVHLSDWWHPPQRAGIRAITVYDLVPLHFPEWTKLRTRAGHRATYHHVLGSCDLVFVISAYTRDDVVRTLGVPEERMRVARPGVDGHFSADGPRADLGRPYVLTVATLEPRKNLETLLAAFELLDGDHALAVVGGGWMGGEARARSPGHPAPRLCLRRGTRIPVPRSVSVRLSISLRGVRNADRGGDGVWGSRGRLGSPLDGRGCRRRGASCRPRQPGRDRAAIERALGDPGDAVARGLAHAARFTWEDAARVFVEGFSELAH